MLQGALRLSVHLTSKGACSCTVVEIEQPDVYRDIEIKNDWLSNAVAIDDRAWEVATSYLLSIAHNHLCHQQLLLQHLHIVSFLCMIIYSHVFACHDSSIITKS